MLRAFSCGRTPSPRAGTAPPYPHALRRLPLDLILCIYEMGITVPTLPGHMGSQMTHSADHYPVPTWVTISEGRSETSPSLTQELRHRSLGEQLVTICMSPEILHHFCLLTVPLSAPFCVLPSLEEAEQAGTEWPSLHTAQGLSFLLQWASVSLSAQWLR